VRTTKISIAIDKEQLRVARKVAKSEGLSLSAYISRALGNQLQEQVRIDAARELHRLWGRESIPTAKDQEEFLAKMRRGRRQRESAA
jgi:hypothetical protein